MAQTHRDLWPQVVAWENLVAAYRKCRRRKRYKPDAAAFDFGWEGNLLGLVFELLDGSYTPGRYRHFTIHDPKKRKISAAPFRDRVVHHALVRVLEPIFERRFVYDSYACRKGRGTHRALDRAQRYLRRHAFYLKTDIVRFFPNVDHELLLRDLSRTIRDDEVMALIGKIVASGVGVLDEDATPDVFPGDDLFAQLRPKGLPIGNLTSQFFANVLLDPIDHFIKEELRIAGYVRYADDLLLFGDSKKELWRAHDAVASRLALVRLCLHDGKTQVRPAGSGLKFLGFVLHRSSRRLQQGNLRRFNRRLRRFQWLARHGAGVAAEYSGSLRAWLAHAGGANSVGIRRALWKRVRLERKPNRPPR